MSRNLSTSAAVIVNISNISFVKFFKIVCEVLMNKYNFLLGLTQDNTLWYTKKSISLEPSSFCDKFYRLLFLFGVFFSQFLIENLAPEKQSEFE